MSIIKYKRIVTSSSSGSGGGITSVVAGANITIDNTDPSNPIINGISQQPTVVTNYSALPTANTVTGKFYWCSNSQGTSWLPGSLGGTYYNSGLYYSNGTTWEFLNVPYQATQTEVNTGTNTDKFVTPSTFTNASKWSLFGLLAGNNSWSGNNTYSGNISYTGTVNSSLTGANQRIPSHTNPKITFTNASLTSIASANNGSVTDGHTLILTNATGSNLTIVNNYGSAATGEAIYTGSNANIIIPTNSSFWLVWDTTVNGWLCTSSGLIKTINSNSLLGSGDISVSTLIGYTPENVANKSDSYTASSSTTYASTKALVDGLATKQVSGTYATGTGTASGTNTGDETAARIAAINHGTSAKTTLVDADEVTGQDSASSFSLIRTVWSDVFTYIIGKTATSTTTFTNKRITARVSTTASSSTPTPNADTDDEYTVTALAANATFGAPSGTPTEGQKLIIRIKDNGTARTLAFNAIYRFSSDLAAPTTTVISKTFYLGFVYNNTDSKWDNIAQLNNF